MPTLDQILSPGSLIPEIARCWTPGQGMPCCSLVRIVMLATMDRIPVEARNGQASLAPWRGVDPKWSEANLARADWGPWDALYANWLHKGSAVELHDPKLTPGRWHCAQDWTSDLRSSGHVYLEHLSDDGLTLRRVQSGVSKGYRDDSIPFATNWPRRASRTIGVLTLPEGT